MTASSDITTFYSASKDHSCKEFTIHKKTGESFSVIEYGALIHTLCVPDKEGKLGDIMLGFDTLDGYMNSGSGHGSIIGRTANRTKGASMVIDGITYNMPVNDCGNNLHGGEGCFQNTFWKGEIIDEARAQSYVDGIVTASGLQMEGDAVLLTSLSPDGTCGLPGNLTTEIMYGWSEDATLIILYRGVSDKKTAFAPTNHSYINLYGENQGSISGQLLWIDADEYTQKDMCNVPTGTILPLQGTPLDFREEHAVDEVLCETSSFAELNCSKGADQNYCLKTTPNTYTRFASVYAPRTGRFMEAFTNFPGVQLYCGNHLNEDGKNGTHYVGYNAICLEAQVFPDAIHHDNFASAIIDKDEVKGYLCGYRFSTK